MRGLQSAESIRANNDLKIQLTALIGEEASESYLPFISLAEEQFGVSAYDCGTINTTIDNSYSFLTVHENNQTVLLHPT